jgi:hypothetical protein
MKKIIFSDHAKQRILQRDWNLETVLFAFKQQNSTNPTEMQGIFGAPKIARQFLRVLIGG